jgi:anaerobic magnesium-protoporphyrin IX monomethyl ester cyclase
MKRSWRTILRPEGPLAAAAKRVLIVSIECNAEASETPMLAPAFLVAHARSEGFVRQHVEFEIRQFSVEEPLEAMIEEIIAKDYDAVGFSCYVWNFGIFEQLIPVLKRLKPRSLFILGGPQVLDQEHAVFRSLPELDLLVYRDGEAAFRGVMVELASERRNWSAVGGILSRNADEIVDTRLARKPVKFAEIASPYIDGVITGTHPNLFMETYRGCPYTCAFCAWGGDEGPMNDLLPMDRIKREIELISGMGAYSIGFFDANFNQPPERANNIYDALLEAGTFKTVGMSIFAQTLRESLVNRMKKTQTFIGVGLQSSDVNVNRIMKRRYRDEKMIAGLNLLKANRISYALQVIVGLPGDTYESISETLRYAVSFEPPTLDAFRLMILPGTEYRRRAEELKIVYAPRPYHYVVSHYSMDAVQINRAERMAQALSLFYNLHSTRREMLAQVAENNESIIEWSEAMGSFLESFALMDRAELRKGDIIRTKDEAYLLKVIKDFRHFRAELSVTQAYEQVTCQTPPTRNQYTYIPILSN